MISRKQCEEAQARAARMLEDAGIAITPEERKNIEVADLGLGELMRTGVQILTYINNDRYCAKELILFPGQTCPEHLHPPVEGKSGKMETFRCRRGKVWLYVEGDPSPVVHARVPEGSEAGYTVFHEIELNPGDQYTLPPDTKHWFQAAGRGSVVSEFSTTSRDELDVFSDSRIDRVPRIGSD